MVLHGKCILITGGTTLTGQACARALASNGALVMISAEDPFSLETTLQSIRSQVPGCSIIGCVADLSTDEGMEAFFLHAKVVFPKIDVVVISPVAAWANSVFGSIPVYMTCIRKAASVIGCHKTGNIIGISSKATDEDLAALSTELYRGTVTNEGVRISVVRPVTAIGNYDLANNETCVEAEQTAAAIVYALRAPQVCQVTHIQVG